MIPYSPSISHAADGLSTTNAIYKWLKGESLPTPDIELAYDEMVIQTTGYQNRKTGPTCDGCCNRIPKTAFDSWLEKEIN